MERFELNKYAADGNPLIMIFTEGTIIGPKRFIDFFNVKKYEPIKDCIEKIKKWNRQGAQIIYLTSRKTEISAQTIKDLLIRNQFVGDYLYYRTGSDKYKDIVESLKPDILIEDNCRSIGGAWQMAITYVDKNIKENIKSIVIKEFKGIDNLPDNLIDLMKFETKQCMNAQ
ncbi:MAG: hypothetical protein GX587_05360 [Bacteroidales bacterium]|nr:hypothetical protein [Bacteroidales bacterium]